MMTPDIEGSQLWTARWIWCDRSTPNQWACFRRTIDLDAVPNDGSLRIAVDSKYWLWVNGTLVVREGGLKRGPTPTGGYFDRVDVAPFLRPGRNVFAVLAWHFGKDGASHRDSGQGGLVVEPENQALETLRTDARWRARVHPAFKDTGDGWSVTLSEKAIVFDAREDLVDWTTADFDDHDDHDWPAATEFAVPPAAPWGELRERPIPFWRDSRELSFARLEIRPAPAGRRIVRGWLRANLQVLPIVDVASARAGDDVVIKVERDLKTTRYTCRSGPQRFEVPAWGNGHFVDFDLPDRVEADLRYRETRYDVDDDDDDDEARFVAGEPTLDALVRKSIRSVVVNVRDSYMDCPDRERSPWPGDIASTIEATLYGLPRSVDALTRKTLLEFLDWRTEDGVLWGAVPTGRFRGTFRAFPSQTLALIAVGFPEYVWFTGDLDLARRSIGPLSRYLFELWRIDASTGLPTYAFPIGEGWEPGHRDWRDWGDLPIDAAPLDAAWYAAAINGLRRVAEAVGERAAAQRCAETHDRLAASFHRAFWDAARSAYRGPAYAFDGVDDRCNALAVYAGLAPAATHEPIARVLSTCDRSSIYLDKYAVEALCLLGRPDLAIDRIRRRYGDAARSTYTTLPERFGEQSNHAWGNVPLVVLARHFLGFRATAPGCTRVSVAPRDVGFPYAGTIDLPAGPMTFAVAPGLHGGRIQIDLKPPVGVRADVGEPNP